MDVHYDEENQLEKFQWVFGILWHVQSCYDAPKPCDPKKLQKGKHSKDWVWNPKNVEGNIVEWHSRHEIYEEPTPDVISLDDWQIINLTSSNWVEKSGPELNENVKEEAKIYQGIDDQKVDPWHRFWIEPQFERNTKWVVKSQHDNEKLPLSFPWVVLANHKPVIFWAYGLTEHLSGFEEFPHPLREACLELDLFWGQKLLLELQFFLL